MRFARSIPQVRADATDKKWYNLVEIEGMQTLHIYDEIGYWGITASSLVKDLASLGGKDLTVHMNTPGGEVFDGIAIYQALKNYAGNVTVIVDALAASIGSVIAMAGNKVVMAKNATMMIHEGHTVCAGNAAEMQHKAMQLDNASANIASIYAERAGGSVESWREYMRAETWFNAEETVRVGLADEIQGQSDASNVWDLSMYNYAGRMYAPDPVINVQEKDTPIDWDNVAQSMKGVFH
jgi:ATP-dependent Clp endopeptidase proteolytic subunit ClpP